MSYGWSVGAIALVVAALTCRIVWTWALRRVPERLIRTNVDGRAVPVVLGWGVAAGILAGHLVWAIAAYIEHRRFAQGVCPPGEICLLDLILHHYPWETVVALLVLSAGMFGVGLWDDFKGDERPRGFRGHLSSARRARWTGGLVKLIGGSITALVTVFFFGSFYVGWDALFAAACIAMSANLINLFDRAPGRAGKVFFILAIPVAIGPTAWGPVVLAGAIGAVGAALPLDLRAQGMLGDTGANSIGAFLGLGLALTALESASWGIHLLALILLALNLASEKWSFSEVIAKNRVLARLDHLGRE